MSVEVFTTYILKRTTKIYRVDIFTGFADSAYMNSSALPSYISNCGRGITITITLAKFTRLFTCFATGNLSLSFAALEDFLGVFDFFLGR